MKRTFHPTRSRLLPLLGFLTLLAAGALSSCSEDNGSSGPNNNNGNNNNTGGGHDNDPRFVTTLQLADVASTATSVFQRDELIQMTLTIRNRTTEAQAVEFKTGRQADFIVVRENSDNVIWKLSEVSAAPGQMPTSLRFAPGETKTITTTWNQVDSNGSSARVGSYEARGVLVFDGFDSAPLRASELGSELERFTIN